MDGMSLYVKNPKEYILKRERERGKKKHLELVIEFSKVTGYKINTQNQSYYTYSQWTCEHWNLKYNTICNTPQNSGNTIMCKPNKTCLRLVYWKLQKAYEKNQRRYK